MAGWRVQAALLLLALLALLGAGALVYETWWDDFSTLNHYEALGVAANAPPRDIKRAFRELSLQYHPDKSAAGTTELFTKRFLRISDAYQVLSDAQTRIAYDHELAERARFRALEQQSWRRKLTPTMRDWPSVLQFYTMEFPIALASLALLVLDVRLLMMALVCLGVRCVETRKRRSDASSAASAAASARRSTDTRYVDQSNNVITLVGCYIYEHYGPRTMWRIASFGIVPLAIVFATVFASVAHSFTGQSPTRKHSVGSHRESMGILGSYGDLSVLAAEHHEPYDSYGTAGTASSLQIGDLV